MADVYAVDFNLREAVLDDGKHCPITNLFDEFGEETEDIDEAFSAVAFECDGKWHTIDLTQFSQAHRF